MTRQMVIHLRDARGGHEAEIPVFFDYIHHVEMYPHAKVNLKSHYFKWTATVGRLGTISVGFVIKSI